jgi:hypothetical protein
MPEDRAAKKKRGTEMKDQKGGRREEDQQAAHDSEGSNRMGTLRDSLDNGQRAEQIANPTRMSLRLPSASPLAGFRLGLKG